VHTPAYGARLLLAPVVLGTLHLLPASLEFANGKREAYLYSAFYMLCISRSAQAWITQFYLQIPACLSFVSVHQMAPPNWGERHPIAAYYSIYRPRSDERLSWPGWLTYS